MANLSPVDCHCGGKPYARRGAGGFSETPSSVTCMNPNCGLQMHAGSLDTNIEPAVIRWNAIQKKLKASK